MSRIEIVIHSAVAAVWVCLAVVLGLKIALLGNEQSALNRAAGADRKDRMEMAVQHDRLRAQLAYEASPPALADAVRQLGLPLKAPDHLATR